MSNSYVDLFLNSAYAEADYMAPLTLLFLFFGRMLPIISQSSFFGGKVLPGPAKIFLTFSLFIIFIPQLLMTAKAPVTFSVEMVLMMLKEIFVGFAIGFMINIPFVIVQTSGMLIDHQRGGASLMVNDPTIQNQSSPLGTLFNMVMIVVFYGINGPFLFLDAIMTSYEIIPMDQFLNPAFFQQDQPFWQIQIKLFNKVVLMGTQLATPALLAILMTDVFLGIANRLAPQVQITFLGMPLKSLLALVVVTFGWQLMTIEMSKQGYYWLNEEKAMIQAFDIHHPKAVTPK